MCPWDPFAFCCSLKVARCRLHAPTRHVQEDALQLCARPLLPGVIDRWELIQAQALSKELRMKQNLQKWQQFGSDLNNIWTWLGVTEEELEQLRRLELSTDIQSIELQIKKLKVSCPWPGPERPDRKLARGRPGRGAMSPSRAA